MTKNRLQVDKRARNGNSLRALHPMVSGLEQRVKKINSRKKPLVDAGPKGGAKYPFE